MSLRWLSIRTVVAALAISFAIHSAAAADCPGWRAPSVSVHAASDGAVRAGDQVEVDWTSSGAPTGECRYPLYLVVSTQAHVRFEGKGFLAMPPGALGPFNIAEKQDATRVFIPLHPRSSEASGSFKIAFYSGGPARLDWFVVGLPSASWDEKSWAPNTHIASGDEQALMVESGKPVIVVRDAFAPTLVTATGKVEAPLKTIISNSNEFELQVFPKFYRVLDAPTGDMVLERAGRDPNFSPASRFLTAFAEGAGLEIIDLYAGKVVAASSNLNRLGHFEGGGHLAAWTRSDAVVVVSFWGYGGVYAQQALVDGSGVGDGAPNCHACQGIGDVFLFNFQTGLAAWSSQEKGWASLIETDLGSNAAKAEAERRIPVDLNAENFDQDAMDRQTKLIGQLSQSAITDYGQRYFFNGPEFLARLPENPTPPLDGSGWRLDGDLELSPACRPEADGACGVSSDSEQGRNELRALMRLAVVHHGVKPQTRPQEQMADARLLVARAAIAAEAKAAPLNVWRRLNELGVATANDTRTNAAIAEFDWDTLFKSPSAAIIKVAQNFSAIRQVFGKSAESGISEDWVTKPQNLNAEHELVKIDSGRVVRTAAWRLGGEEYRLVLEDYQSGNAGTANNQYLHLISGNDARVTRVIDISTRLIANGVIARSTDQADLPDHTWPTDFDIVEVEAGRYLLASGHWLYDHERWAMVYDLKADKTLFFNGRLPNATSTASLAISPDGRTFIAANSGGQIYFYDVASGKQSLTGAYVDDELAIFDENGYYAATPEGGQLVFLKFPGLPGYQSFRQFAKTLNRPDVIQNALDGGPAAPAPSLSPPPRLNALLKSGSAGDGLPAILDASSARPLSAVRLYIDGVIWRELPATGTDFHFSDTLDTPPQSRWLTAVAVDYAGEESAPVALPLPHDSRPSGRTLYLEAVGTNAYPGLGKDRQLTSAVSDARNFGGAVASLKSDYYKSVGVETFLDAPGLAQELPRRLAEVAKKAQAGDTILLFVSGHGYRDQSGKLYLAVAESQAGRLAETSLAWSDIASALAATKARIIVLIDACHSGAAEDGGSNDEIASTLAAGRIPFTVLAAAKGRQESFERPQQGGGVFTSAIVKALSMDRRATDSNGNGVIELSELYGRIKPEVLKEMEGRQTPWLARSDMVGEVPLF